MDDCQQRDAGGSSAVDANVRLLVFVAVRAVVQLEAVVLWIWQHLPLPNLIGWKTELSLLPPQLVVDYPMLALFLPFSPSQAIARFETSFFSHWVFRASDKNPWSLRPSSIPNESLAALNICLQCGILQKLFNTLYRINSSISF
jgi:hypothetical protein